MFHRANVLFEIEYLVIVGGKENQEYEVKHDKGKSTGRHLVGLGTHLQERSLVPTS